MRKNILIYVSTALTLVIAIFLIYHSGIISGLDTEVDAAVEADIRSAYLATVKEGRIYDGNEEPITVKNDSLRGETDQESDEEEPLAKCLYPEAYNWLGYSSEIYGPEGFRYLHRNELFTQEGNTEIYLTTQNRLQQYCYDLLEGKKGAVVVLENGTGKILAMAGRADAEVEYDVNAIDEEGRKAVYDEVGGMYLNQALCTDAPGSVFKIVTTTALAENGLSGFRFEDTGCYNGVTNAGEGSYGEIGLEDAFVNSVNTYFAAALDALGAKKMERTARKFMVGETVELDFGVMKSNMDMEYYQDTRLNEDTAYGQGKTLISPVHMAMILSTVVNCGTMYKPYVIDSIHEGEEITYHGEPEVLSVDMDALVLQEVKGYLHDAALNYGFEEDEFGVIYAKTGTAEKGSGTYHAYLAAANDKITIVFSVNDSTESGYALVPAVKEIFRYIGK